MYNVYSQMYLKVIIITARIFSVIIIFTLHVMYLSHTMITITYGYFENCI